MPKRIVLTGGPSTGKTSVIQQLKMLQYPCLDEVSRQVIQRAKEQGVDQLFLEDPLQFSQLLLDARIQQFIDAETSTTVSLYIDRGIPDTVAYMHYINEPYPEHFKSACQTYRYDQVFMFPIWDKIYTDDAERYENLEQAQRIQEQLERTYTYYEYHYTIVPQGSIKERAQFIINQTAID